MSDHPFGGRLPPGYTSWVIDSMRNVWAVANARGEIRHHMVDANFTKWDQHRAIWRRYYKERSS